MAGLSLADRAMKLKYLDVLDDVLRTDPYKKASRAMTSVLSKHGVVSDSCNNKGASEFSSLEETRCCALTRSLRLAQSCILKMNVLKDDLKSLAPPPTLIDKSHQDHVEKATLTGHLLIPLIGDVGTIAKTVCETAVGLHIAEDFLRLPEDIKLLDFSATGRIQIPNYSHNHDSQLRLQLLYWTALKWLKGFREKETCEENAQFISIFYTFIQVIRDYTEAIRLANHVFRVLLYPNAFGKKTLQEYVLCLEHVVKSDMIMEVQSLRRALESIQNNFERTFGLQKINKKPPNKLKEKIVNEPMSCPEFTLLALAEARMKSELPSYQQLVKEHGTSGKIVLGKPPKSKSSMRNNNVSRSRLKNTNVPPTGVGGKGDYVSRTGSILPADYKQASSKSRLGSRTSIPHATLSALTQMKGCHIKNVLRASKRCLQQLRAANDGLSEQVAQDVQLSRGIQKRNPSEDHRQLANVALSVTNLCREAFVPAHRLNQTAIALYHAEDFLRYPNDLEAFSSQGTKGRIKIPDITFNSETVMKLRQVVDLAATTYNGFDGEGRIGEDLQEVLFSVLRGFQDFYGAALGCQEIFKVLLYSGQNEKGHLQQFLLGMTAMERSELLVEIQDMRRIIDEIVISLEKLSWGSFIIYRVAGGENTSSASYVFPSPSPPPPPPPAAAPPSNFSPGPAATVSKNSTSSLPTYLAYPMLAARKSKLKKTIEEFIADDKPSMDIDSPNPSSIRSFSTEERPDPKDNIRKKSSISKVQSQHRANRAPLNRKESNNKVGAT